MKFCDFWFEIPSAFINLLKNSNFMSLEVEKYNLLFKTYKVTNIHYKRISYHLMRNFLRKFQFFKTIRNFLKVKIQ